MAKTIMIVDDDPDSVADVRALLEKNGYNVVIALSGDDCLRKLVRQKADLVLLDIMAPGMPAREVVSRIKGAKVAFLSVVRISDAERTDIFRTGKIADYIQKPFDPDDLLSRVRKIIGK